MKKNTWLLLVLCLPLLGMSQGVKTNLYDKFLKKQRIEMEPVVLTGLPDNNRLSIEFTAIASDLYLSLRGAGWGAATVDKENDLVLFFSNGSSIALKAASLQSFEPGLTENVYHHYYLLNTKQLEALSQSNLEGLRKYSFTTYSDLTLPAENREVIKTTSARFLSELKKANIGTSVKQINVKDIRNYIGDSISFCSKIYRTRYFNESEEGPTVLDMQADFLDPLVNVVILEKDRFKFGQAPEAFFLNRHVCISGLVRLRNNVPYLVLEYPQQIQLTDSLEKNSAALVSGRQESLDQTISTRAAIHNDPSRTKETLAEFPGGAAAFQNYLEKNLTPAAAASQKKGFQVIASFIIDAQGNCSGIKILESAGSTFDAEVKKVLMKMPKWKPAFSNGRFIASRITQPITIRGA